MNTDSNLGRFAYAVGMLIIDAAGVHGWIVRDVERSSSGSCYLRLRHRRTKCTMTVRISDHPIRPGAGKGKRPGPTHSIEPGQGAERLASLFRFLAHHAGRWRRRRRKLATAQTQAGDGADASG